jgi:hypothetical protein
VVSDSDSSEESEEESEVQESVAISRVVSEILGRTGSGDSSAHIFAYPVPSDRPDVAEVDASTPGFQEKEKASFPSKKETVSIVRKDGITGANLAESKIKEISKYTCCDNLCLRKLGSRQVKKHRIYYYRLKPSERNVLLRGCIQNRHTGKTGYQVLGLPFCREGFKKLYSVGNDRLQRVTQDIFLRVDREIFRKQTSTNQLTLVEWLKDFFATSVESLPNKDIFHLPDNWTKQEVFEVFKKDSLLWEESNVTYSWFCRIWSMEFPRVRIPKRSRFSTCAPCTEFKALRDKATLESERGEQLLLFIFETL